MAHDVVGHRGRISRRGNFLLVEFVVEFGTVIGEFVAEFGIFVGSTGPHGGEIGAVQAAFIDFTTVEQAVERHERGG